jgi:hypothetical protein
METSLAGMLRRRRPAPGLSMSAPAACAGVAIAAISGGEAVAHRLRTTELELPARQTRNGTAVVGRVRDLH